MCVHTDIAPDHNFAIAMAAINGNGYFELIDHPISLSKI